MWINGRCSHFSLTPTFGGKRFITFTFKIVVVGISFYIGGLFKVNGAPRRLLMDMTKGVFYGNYRKGNGSGFRLEESLNIYEL